MDFSRVIAIVLFIALVVVSVLLFRAKSEIKKLKPLAELNQSQIDQRVEEVKRTLDEANEAELAKRLDAELRVPFKDYKVDDTFGAFTFKFPRFWYVFEKQESGLKKLRIWIDPNPIRDLGKSSPPCEQICAAIRIELLDKSYSSSLASLEADKSQREKNKLTPAENKITESDITISGINGKKFVGKLPSEKIDAPAVYIILPYREKTLYLISDNKDTKLADETTYETQLNKFLESLTLNK